MPSKTANNQGIPDTANNVEKTKYMSKHVLSDSMNPGADLIVKSCVTNVRDGALGHSIDHLKYLFVDSKS